jgi:hypothetical protein
VAAGDSISGTFLEAGGGEWTLTTGVYTLTFSESLGTLTATAIPEPSVFTAMAGLAGLAFAANRRRRCAR